LLKSLAFFGIIVSFYLYFSKHTASNKPTAGSYNFIKVNSHKTSEGKTGASRIEAIQYANDIEHLTVKSSTCSQFNFSFASAIIEPDLGDQKSNLFLFILIASGVGKRSFLDKRNAIRSTWLGYNDNASLKIWRHAFMLGRSEDDRKVGVEIRQEAGFYNDILQVNSTDNYQNLIIKVLSGFRWVFTQVKPQFILKADDDVYIRLPRLMPWLNESKRDNFYGGDINRAPLLSPGWLSNKGPPVRRKIDTQVNAITRDCYMEDYFPPYSAGPFYVLSANTMSSLFQNMRKWKVFPVEDAYMGVLARASGLKPVEIPGFRVDNNQEIITCSNLFSCNKCAWAWFVASGHNFSSSQLHYIHNKLQETDKLHLSRNFLLCLAHESFIMFFRLILLVCIIAVLASLCFLISYFLA